MRTRTRWMLGICAGVMALICLLLFASEPSASPRRIWIRLAPNGDIAAVSDAPGGDAIDDFVAGQGKAVYVGRRTGIHGGVLQSFWIGGGRRPAKRTGDDGFEPGEAAMLPKLTRQVEVAQPVRGLGHRISGILSLRREPRPTYVRDDHCNVDGVWLEYLHWLDYGDRLRQQWRNEVDALISRLEQEVNDGGEVDEVKRKRLQRLIRYRAEEQSESRTR